MCRIHPPCPEIHRDRLCSRVRSVAGPVHIPRELCTNLVFSHGFVLRQTNHMSVESVPENAQSTCFPDFPPYFRTLGVKTTGGVRPTEFGAASPHRKPKRTTKPALKLRSRTFKEQRCSTAHQRLISRRVSRPFCRCFLRRNGEGRGALRALNEARPQWFRD